MPIGCFNFWSQSEYYESMILQYHITYLNPNCLRMQRRLIIQCLRCLLNRPIYGLLLLLDPLLNLCLVRNLPRIGLLGCRPAVVEGVSDKSGGPDTDNTTESCDSPIPLGWSKNVTCEHITAWNILIRFLLAQGRGRVWSAQTSYNHVNWVLLWCEITKYSV